MKALFGALVALFLAGCSSEAPPSPVSADYPAEPGEPAAGATVSDDYIVASVDGAPPLINIAGHEPRVTIDKDRIHFQSQCIYADWTYQRDGETISTKPYYEPGSAMCARGLAPGEVAIQDIINEANTVQRTASGLLLEGGGRRLELQRSANSNPNEATAIGLAGEWRVAELNGKEIDKPYAIALSANDEKIWWEPSCALQYREYSIRGRLFIARAAAPSKSAVCDIAYPDELPQIWAALDASKTIERTPANGVRISGDELSVTLFSQ